MALMLMDWDFTLRAELANWTSFFVVRSYYGLGSFELRMPPSAPGAKELQTGRVLFLSDATHKAMLIDKITEKSDQITATGKLIKGVAAQRICVPPTTDDGHFGWDRFTGSAEAAYHHYAGAHLYAPEDEKRRIERLTAAPNRDRGPVLPWQSRFGNLEALLSDIGEATEVGWDILPDFAQRRYVFGITPGRNLTTGPGMVQLSEGNRNASDVTRTYDLTAAKTTAYVGGEGEDENRLILSQNNTVAGIERRETWVDAGSISETEMLTLAAKSKLTGAEPKSTLTATVVDSGLCRYERDYDVGDKLLLIGAGGQSETRLLEMHETYESGGRKLQATFGVAPVTVTRYLRELSAAIIR